MGLWADKIAADSKSLDALSGRSYTKTAELALAMQCFSFITRTFELLVWAKSTQMEGGPYSLLLRATRLYICNDVDVDVPHHSCFFFIFCVVADFDYGEGEGLPASNYGNIGSKPIGSGQPDGHPARARAAHVSSARHE